MQLTRCRLFRVAHTVGLQRIKKPFSLSAVEFGFSCSANTYIYVHACTHTHAWPVYVHTRPGIAIEYDVRMHSLYRSTTFCSLLRNVERQNFDLLRTHVYNREKKRTNCATGPIVRFRWLVFLHPRSIPRHPTFYLSLSLFFFLYVSSPNCRIVLRVVTHRIEIYQSQINADRYKHFSRIPDHIVI